jgi:hypothetical protein
MTSQKLKTLTIRHYDFQQVTRHAGVSPAFFA